MVDVSLFFLKGKMMTEEQFNMFCVLLGGISLPSISLLFAGAWELYNYDVSDTKDKTSDLKLES